MSSTIVVECSGCGSRGRVPVDRFGTNLTCNRCQTRFVAQPVPPDREPESSSHSPFECPLCVGEPLTPSDQELDVLSCQACQGDLVRNEGVETLVTDHLKLNTQILSQLETFTRAEPIRCSGCSAEMTLLKLKGVAVDWCADCANLWLDAGELHRLSSGRWGRPVERKAPSERLSDPMRIGLGRLDDLKSCQVRQSTRGNAATVLLGWDHANWYDVRSGMGTVAVVAEQRRGWIDDLLRNFTSNQGRKLYVLDKYSSTVLLELSRSWFILTSSMKVTMGQDGEQIGHVRRSLNPIFKEYVLRGADGEIFARINSPVWRFWRFFIRDPATGAQLGVIRKRWSGWFKEAYTRADNFEIEFGDHSWTLEQRCTLLAAAIAIDLDRFEQK